MTRTIALSFLVAAVSALPAFAEQSADGKPGLGNPFTMENARKHLQLQGYKDVSVLTKSEGGKWVGTATKDGKTGPVAVDVKPTALKAVK